MKLKSCGAHTRVIDGSDSADTRTSTRRPTPLPRRAQASRRCPSKEMAGLLGGTAAELLKIS